MDPSAPTAKTSSVESPHSGKKHHRKHHKGKSSSGNPDNANETQLQLHVRDPVLFHQLNRESLRGLVVAAVISLVVLAVVISLVWGSTAAPLKPSSVANTSDGATTLSAIKSTPSCPAIVNLSAGAAVVTTTTGRVVGNTVSVGGVSLSRWLGVPYAQSTAGKRRYTSPMPLEVSDPCLAVTVEEPHPPCAYWVEGTGVVGSEDCLRFNIWAPTETAAGGAKRALVLAATGHWFQRGTNDVPQWEQLAAQANVTVMSPNVRLGVLGFLHPDIKGIANDVAEEDAKAALQWALDNAAAFGANPSALMLVGNGTGAYLLAQAAAMLKVNVSRAVFEGSLYKSLVPFNTDSEDPCKVLAKKLGCDGNKRDSWPACFSSASLEALLSNAARMELRFGPSTGLGIIMSGGNRKLPQITDVIAGVDIAQAISLIEEYVMPKAVESGYNVKNASALFSFSLKYLFGRESFVTSLVERYLNNTGDEESSRMLLAMAISGCGTLSSTLAASQGYHYIVDGGAQPLFEPVLSTADVAWFLSEGKVPSLKSGMAWPTSKNGSRLLFANNTDVVDTTMTQICQVLSK